MVTLTSKRRNTPVRWQAALKRVHTEGVQVRQLAGSGMWIATSATDAGAAYEVTPWECECPVCNGMRFHTAPVPLGETWRTGTVACARCGGTGHEQTSRAA